ncbi:mucin-17-like isoform X4 [Halichondria panicea]|uniref:mucin-17-like isoform X4 n=1 Tax=Halichondria panicea TaxID=6063 RepID=UPI00312B8051
MEPDDNMESDLSPRHVAHVSSSLPFTEPSQSLSPPPGPSGIISLLSPPQPDITPNQPQISTSNQYQLAATINRLHLAASNQHQTATTTLSSSAQNHSAAQTGNSISAQTQASARTIQSAVTNRDGGRGQITGPTASPAAAVRRGATPTTVGSSGATGGGSTNSNIFQIPLSQDILAGSNDLSLGLGESQSVGYDFTPPDMRALIRADEQRQMAEDVRRSQLEKEGREVLARVLAEEGRSSDLQFGGRSYPLRGNEETVTPASQSDSGSQDQPALPPYSNELTQRANRRIKRLRDRLKGTPVVPGTESSRSSDEGKAASLRAAKLKMEHRITSGVPESTLSTHSRASKALDNQIVVVTGASESGLSSSESGRRVPKKKSVQTQHKTMPSTVEVTRAPTTPSPEEDETRRDETLSDDSTTDEETQDIEPPPVITAGIKLAPPSWGAETDASTEYPGTQTTSSGSDKATPSSGSSCSVDGSQATVPQTLPLVSSTPYEDDVTTALPGLLGLYKICKKQLSNETSSSTTTTRSSSSGGDIEKIRANRRTQIHSQRTQEESLGSFEVPLALQTLSAEMHDPAPPQSDEVGAPSSLQSEIETQPLDDSSQNIFHNLGIVRDSQEELANEKPAWYAKMMDETQVMDPADDGKKTGDKIQRLEQAQPSAKSKITSSPQSKSQSQPFFKNPNSSTSCSPASKDSSFTGSQGPSTSSSSSNSSKSSLPTSSSTCSSNDPGSVISSNTSSDSSNSTHQQSISVRSNDEQEAMDTNPSSQNPVTKSGKEDDQVKENHSEDDDNTVTLEMESPIMIDLTCQSQSLGEGENQECDKSTSLIETLCSPDILHVSVEKGTEEMEDLLRDDEAMDTDTASQDSFCLHYSPSQSHPIRETSPAASKETTPLNSMESEEFSLQNTMNPASSCKRNLLNIEVDNSQTLKADDSKSLQNLSPTAIVSRTQSPLYESLLLDNSSESIQGSIKSRSVTALMPTEVTHGVQQHESPAHTPTSAPFRLNLPSGSLIEPLTTITPPSQPAHTIQQSAPPAVAGTTSNADRLPTGDKSTVLQIPASPLSVLSSTDTDSVLSNRNTRQSDTDSFGLHLDTATSGSSQISEDEINHSIPDPLQTVVDQPLSTSDTTERQSVARNEEEVKISAESTNLDGSEDSQAAEESVTVSTCLKNSSDVQSITREATGSPRTPRKSLSLKNRRTPKRPGKESQKPENTTVPGFVLGVLSENSEQSEVDSQIPKVIVLGDSQLECSDSFNLPFSIALPKEASSTASVDTAKALASENQNHGALFSGFRSDATSRVTGRQVSDSCVISESLFNQSKEPHEPQSQYSEVQFVRPRKQRNMPGSVFDSVEVGGSQATEGTNLEQIPHTSTVRSLDQSNEIEPMCVDPPSFGSPSIIQESIQLVDNSIGNHPDNNSTNSSSQEATLSEANRNSQVNNPSSQNLITPTNSQILHPPTIITSLQHPSSSRGLSNSQSCAASFQSPVPSTPLEFTSPYSMISPSGMEELKKQVRREGVNRYELRHVRTIRTVTDHRIVSSEVIKNNRVMNGSSRVWSETCEPEVFQEVKVEMAPRHPLINSSFSFSTSPQLVSTTMIPNVGSSMNIITSQSSLVDSPISSQLCGQENHRNSRETTPTVSHRNSRPPIRRVYPIPSSEDRDTNSSASSHESIDHDHSTSRTVNREANTRPSVKTTQEPSTIRKRASRLPGATPNATYSLCESVRSASKQAGSSTTHSAQTSRKVPKPTTSATKDGCDAKPAALEVGTKVIAKWKDKCWYMATIITDKNKQGRMRVKYADEDTGSVTASNVLLTEFLSEGVSVSAVPILSQSQSSDTLQPDTTVTGVFEGFSDEAQETFILRSGNELKTFSSACLCVQSDAIKSCTLDSKIPHKTMVNRKRKRRSVKESDGVTLPSSTKKKRLSSGTTTTAISRGQGHMFRGYVFMLTQRTKEDSQTASPKTSIDKETAVKQIRSKAGRIADTLTKQEVIDGRTFVLSDSFCKTKKYLLGLALDVPCITYSWLSDCIQQGKVLDYADYRLPAGVNNFDGTVIPWSPCSRSIMFKECTVHVVGIETFKRHWGSIAEACGASILSKLPTMTARSRSNSGSVVVVAEHPDQISPSLQHQSSLDTLCILSHTWIVQCLIQGQLLSYDRFRINKC